jgi:hypothetical protein
LGCGLQAGARKRSNASRRRSTEERSDGTLAARGGRNTIPGNQHENVRDAGVDLLLTALVTPRGGAVPESCSAVIGKVSAECAPAAVCFVVPC